jgi:predicted MPP superfamily phosphohydrolase
MKLFSLVLLNFLLFFCAFSSDLLAEKPLRFITLGDWGVKGQNSQDQVARSMSRYALKKPTKFILTVGDNFYNSGVQSVTDTHWQESWINIYKKPGLSRLNWFISAGNHDYGGSIQAQIDYSKINPRWKFPQRYYKKQFRTENLTADFFFIDTSPFISSYYNKASMPEIDVEKEKINIQKSWLRRKLRNSDAEWKIVVGHHPFYSSTPARAKERSDLSAELLKLFQRHKPDLYLSGHDHDLQLIKSPELKTFQVISGGGNNSRAGVATENHLFLGSSVGFTALELKKDSFKIEFINENSSTLFSREYRNKN